MNKKTIFLLLIIPILLTGCGSKSGETESNEVTTTQEVTTEVITEAVTEETTTTTSKKTEKPTKTTTSLAANMYKQVEDGKYHKYTYVFDDEATCNAKAAGEYGDAAEKSGKVIMFYGCDEVISQKGETKWGLYYMTSTSKDSKFYW